MNRHSRRVFVLILALAPFAPASGQAGGVWLPANAQPPLNNFLLTVATGPGGAVYVGGPFGQPASHVARWAPGATGGSWEALGAGVVSTVHALAVAPDGTVYVGGAFTQAGGQNASFVARWVPGADGAGVWSPLGAGTDGVVEALAFAPDGSLYVAGNFLNAGGAPARNVARWTPDGGSGGTWSALGAGIPGNGVTSLTVASDGSVYAGGFFSQAGGGGARAVARWTPGGAGGGTWSPLGEGVAGWVRALAVGSSGEVYVGGEFSDAGGAGGPSYLARWTPGAAGGGGTWSGLGAGVDGFVRALAVGPDGTVFVGGQFAAAGGVPSPRFARWAPTAVSAEPEASAKGLFLGAPQPNPARGLVSVRVGSAGAGPVRVTVHDVLGRTVAVLADGLLPSGDQVVTWDASGAAAGAYVLRAERGGAIASRRVVVL